MFLQITWEQGDATKAEDVQRVVAAGGFTGVVHAIGMVYPLSRAHSL